MKFFILFLTLILENILCSSNKYINKDEKVENYLDFINQNYPSLLPNKNEKFTILNKFKEKENNIQTLNLNNYEVNSERKNQENYLLDNDNIKENSNSLSYEKSSDLNDFSSDDYKNYIDKFNKYTKSPENVEIIQSPQRNLYFNNNIRNNNDHFQNEELFSREQTEDPKQILMENNNNNIIDINNRMNEDYDKKIYSRKYISRIPQREEDFSTDNSENILIDNHNNGRINENNEISRKKIIESPIQHKIYLDNSMLKRNNHILRENSKKLHIIEPPFEKIYLNKVKNIPSVQNNYILHEKPKEVIVQNLPVNHEKVLVTNNLPYRQVRAVPNFDCNPVILYKYSY